MNTPLDTPWKQILEDYFPQFMDFFFPEAYSALENGQQLILYSEDLEADGVVQFSEDEKVWVAMIDWNQIKQVDQLRRPNTTLQPTVS